LLPRPPQISSRSRAIDECLRTNLSVPGSIIARRIPTRAGRTRESLTSRVSEHANLARGTWRRSCSCAGYIEPYSQLSRNRRKVNSKGFYFFFQLYTMRRAPPTPVPGHQPKTSVVIKKKEIPTPKPGQSTEVYSIEMHRQGALIASISQTQVPSRTTLTPPRQGRESHRCRGPSRRCQS